MALVDPNSDVGTGDSGGLSSSGSPGGKAPLSKNKKIAIGGIGFLVLAGGAYYYAKHKSSSSASTTTTPTTLAVPSSSGDTTGDSGGGGSGQYGGTNGSADWAQQQTANDQQIAADLAPYIPAAIPGATGATGATGPSGTAGTNALPNGGNPAAATVTYSSNVASPGTLTTSGAIQASTPNASTGVAALTPEAALGSEASGLTGAARHAQEESNKLLRSEIVK